MSKNKKRSGTSLPALFSTSFLKKNISREEKYFISRDKSLNILRTKRAFKVKQKAFFINQANNTNFLEGESPTLRINTELSWTWSQRYFNLTLSWRRPLSNRNQSIDLQSKSMDWFLYVNGLRHERVNLNSAKLSSHGCFM